MDTTQKKGHFGVTISSGMATANNSSNTDISRFLIMNRQIAEEIAVFILLKT
jgi:hypothetical protein